MASAAPLQLMSTVLSFDQLVREWLLVSEAGAVGGIVSIAMALWAVVTLPSMLAMLNSILFSVAESATNVIMVAVIVWVLVTPFEPLTLAGRGPTPVDP